MQNTRRPRIVKLILVFTASLMLAPMTTAQTDTVKVPDEVKVFIEKGTIPIALETGDLNADGRKDFILVSSAVVPENAPYEEGAGERSVLLLVRNAGGDLNLAARNELVVLAGEPRFLRSWITERDRNLGVNSPRICRHDQDAVREENGLRDGMRDEKSGPFRLLADREQFFVEMLARHFIERPKRFVGQQDSGRERQRPRDRHAHFLAA